ncbi:hypothetical protein CPC08DRAFT_801500 [Agrocybe pediades]|nr:hypothetical protein CPC08DRAFT_801500 [Agrocybe pediades]
MADPLSITLAAITLGPALKDLTELGLKLHESFKKHAHNMHAAESLAADTLEIVQDIENFYIARGDTLDNLPDVRDAIGRLSKDMQSVYDRCLPMLQHANSPERGLRRTLFKVELWRNSKEVESNIRNLRDNANKCYRRFTRHTQLGTAVAIGELKDLVFKLYVRGHVCKIDAILKNLASTQSYAVEEPDGCHTHPLAIHAFLRLKTSEAVDYVRAGGNPIQAEAWALNDLSLHLRQLEMYTESLILSTWTVDLYKALSKSHQDVYAPHLALAFFNLAVLSYKTRHFAQAMMLTTECLSLLKTSPPIFATEALAACMLSESAHFRCAMGEHSSASLQDVEDSVTVWECLGVDQTSVIDPQHGGNYATLGFMLTEGYWAVHGYAYALDAQRKFLYDSERYQEALNVGEKAIRLYRALGPCYKHVNIQSEVPTLCLFLCDNVFRDVIPLSSALNYAQEAVQIWEDVHGPTATEEEAILDSLGTETELLVEMGRPKDALTVFQELARHVCSMTINQRMYIQKLQDLASILLKQYHHTEPASASRTIVEICRQSIDSLPSSQRSIIEILLDHVGNRACANYLSEALVYSDEALVIARQQHLKDASFTHLYSRCLDWAALLALDSGYPEQALHQIQGALNIGPAIQGHLIGCDSEMLDLISLKALAFLRLARLDLAATTITEGHNFSESTTLNLQEEAYYGKLLHVSAWVHRCTGKQEHALTAIKAAIPIFESCSWDQRLYTLSDVQADMGLDAEALRTAEEAVQLARHYPSLPPYFAYWYRDSQYSLCLRLFFNGKFTRAQQLILEVRRFYEWHAHSRNAWFINLARALRAEGILECVSGRHVEGAAARTRLNELQQRLRATFPGLAHQVDVNLNYERNYPAWKRLREKYLLTCSHWVEDSKSTVM